MQAAEQGSYDLVLSEDLLAEARDVLERPKMRRYFPEGSVPEYIARVRKAAAMVLGHFTEDVPSYTQDPDDDYLVELAFASEADVLVSGDPHLSGSFGSSRGGRRREVRTLTPSEFVAELDEE